MRDTDQHDLQPAVVETGDDESASAATPSAGHDVALRVLLQILDQIRTETAGVDHGIVVWRTEGGGEGSWPAAPEPTGTPIVRAPCARTRGPAAVTRLARRRRR